jgi:hypothetical protein
MPGAVGELAKGGELMARSLVLMIPLNAERQAANEAATRRTSHRGKRVQ